MDITELLTYMQDIIDIKHLGEQLQRKPLIQTEAGTWRALTEDEALAVVNLVGEAIGLRWAAKIAG